MARLPYVDPNEAPPPVREVLRAMPPLNVFRTMAHAETAFRPWMRWGGVLLNDLALDPLLRELAILRVANLSPGADYEWVQHVPIAGSVGARDEQIDALERGDIEASCFTDDQRAVLEFTTEVVREVGASDRAFAAVAGLLSPREIVELLMVIGQYMMLARVMATTHIDLDEPADPRIAIEQDPGSPLKPGMTREEEFVAEGPLLTTVGGTLLVPVLSTPGMIGKMEGNAARLARSVLPENQGTVGFEVRVKHVAGAVEGARCTAFATLRRVIDGRKLRFDVEVREGDRVLGLGTHERRVIDLEGHARALGR
jgi:predicted thioesterase/alkylhydroperoxidase family enzyme